MWEYKIESLLFSEPDVVQEFLSEQGRQGWELVSVIPNALGDEKEWSIAVLKRHQGAFRQP